MFWLRAGDGGEYQSHGEDLEALCDALLELDPGGCIHWQAGGLETDRYRGNNYLSLFYGNASAEIIRELDAGERQYVQHRLGVSDEA